MGIFVPPQFENRLTCQPYRSGELAVLVPLGHALAPRDGVPFGALLDFDIGGLHFGAAAQEQMHQRAQALGRPLNARLQVRGIDAIALWWRPAWAWRCCRRWWRSALPASLP